MTIQLFEELSLHIGIGVLVLYMLFMMYDLSKQAGAGRHAFWVIFMTLGLGIGSFVIKSVITAVITI